MIKVFRKFSYGLFIFLWVFLCAEVSLRFVSTFTHVFSIEMLKYAKALQIPSSYPTLSHEHRPNARATLMGVDVELNSQGHRNQELKNPKPANEKRIHFLGNSITFGWGMQNDQTFTNLLEKRLNTEISPHTGMNYTVINAGIANYNTFYMVELFKKQKKSTKPDIVVLQYFINDAEPNPTANDNPLFRYSFIASTIYQYFQVLTAVTGKNLSEHYREFYAGESPHLKNMKKSLANLKAITDEMDVPLIVLLIPELRNLSNGNPYLPIYKIVEKIFAEMNITMIDSTSAISAIYQHKSRQAWLTNSDPHPNASVHKIISEVIFDHVARNEMRGRARP